MRAPSSVALWVVYSAPLNFPDLFVARKWLGQRPTAELVKSATLAYVRRQLPMGLFRLDLPPEDHPKIVEIWI